MVTNFCLWWDCDWTYRNTNWVFLNQNWTSVVFMLYYNFNRYVEQVVMILRKNDISDCLNSHLQSPTLDRQFIVNMLSSLSDAFFFIWWMLSSSCDAFFVMRFFVRYVMLSLWDAFLVMWCFLGGVALSSSHDAFSLMWWFLCFSAR